MMTNSLFNYHEHMQAMQANSYFTDVTIFKYLVGVIGFLIIILNGILVYFISGIHRTITRNDKLLTQVTAEHCIFHKDDTKIINPQ